MPEEPQLLTARCVYRAAFGTPSVVLAGSRWWAYAASGPAGTVPALSSVDLVHWEREGDVLAAPGSWAAPGPVGSPEVVELGPDRFALYYTAVCAEHRLPAVGVAVASSPAGPFRDRPGAGPLVCRPARGGARAAGVFFETDRTAVLSWTDGAAPSRVWSRALAAAGTALPEDSTRADTGDTLLLAATLAWHGGAVGDARVVRTTGGLVLLYSAGPAGPAVPAATAGSPGPAGALRSAGSGRCLALARAADAGSDTAFPDSPRFVPDPDPLTVTGDGSRGPFGSPGRGAPVRHPDGSWWLVFDAPAAAGRGAMGHQPLLWLAALDPGRRASAVGAAAFAGVGTTPGPAPLPVPPGRWRLPIPADPTPEQERVLRSFVVHGAIRALPAQHGRRVVLLDLLAQLFEPGLRYPEPEVDRRLSGVWAPGVHPDYARLRRLLVDEGFLDRRGGVYRRSGGTV